MLSYNRRRSFVYHASICSVSLLVPLVAVSIDIVSIVVCDGEQQRHDIPDIHRPKHCCRAIGFIDTQSPNETCSNGNV